MKFRNLFFSFGGRIGRSDFWLGIAGLLAVQFYILIMIISILLWTVPPEELPTGELATAPVDAAAEYVMSEEAMLIFDLILLALLAVLLLTFWSTLAVMAKRWHDRAKSGWWVLINLIPLVGPIWTFVELGILKGTPRANRYGDVPNRSQPKLTQLDKDRQRMAVAAEMFAAGKLTKAEYTVLRNA